MELAQEPLVIDVETERLGGGVEIGAVNEQGDFSTLGSMIALVQVIETSRTNSPDGMRPLRHGVPDLPLSGLSDRVPLNCGCTLAVTTHAKV